MFCTEKVGLSPKPYYLLTTFTVLNQEAGIIFFFENGPPFHDRQRSHLYIAETLIIMGGITDKIHFCLEDEKRGNWYHSTWETKGITI